MRIGIAAICSAVFLLSAAQRAAAQEYAPTSMTAAEIVAKMTAAIGSLQSGSYLISERGVNGDGTATTVTSQIHGSDVLTLDQDGSFLTEYGRYQGHYWFRDANGNVILQRGIWSNDSSPETQWIAQQSRDVTVRVLGITTAAQAAYVLAFHSTDGDDVTAYVDVKTNLLARVDFGSQVQMQYSDYRPIFGTTTAFDVRYTEPSTPQNSTEWRISSWTESPMSDSAMSIPQTQPLFDVPTQQMTLPARFTYADGTVGDIVLTARINGQDVNLILDSGASDFVIDPGAASQLGLTVRGKRRTSIAGPLDVSQTIVPEMSIGGLTMRNVAFTVLPSVIEDEGVRAVGLIGCDFFAGSIVGLDFKQQTVTLYSRSSFDPAALGLDAVPLRTNGCQAQVAAMFENVPGTFVLDTGGGATVINRSYLNKLPHSIRELDTSSMDRSSDYIGFLGGAVAVNTYTVNDFIFARTLFRTGDVIVPDNYEIGEADGIIGRNVLRIFAVYLDYADGVAFFKLNT